MFPVGFALTLPSLPSAVFRPAAKRHATDTCTPSPLIYHSPPKHPCLFHFIDRLCALSCPLISCSASGCCLFHKSCLSGSAGDATPSLLSWIMYFIYSPLSFYGSVWGQEEKAFYKNINANLISAHPLPPHQSQLQRGHKDGKGDNQLI